MNKTVFYIEDDEDDVLLAEQVLVEMGQNMKKFQHFEEVMELLNNPPPPPAVVFIDLHMPKLDGLQVLKHLRGIPDYATVPIVMFSTAASPAKIQECKEAGANMFLLKPYRLSDVKKSFDYVLHLDWSAYQPSEDKFLYLSECV